MYEDALSEFHRWLTDIAWRVNALVRGPSVLERFHEKIWRWYLDVKILDSENNALERRRDEHIDAILATPRLRDESAGEPRPEWEWWETSRLIRVRDDVGSQDQRVDIEGWAPPDLIHNEPKKYWPLPLSKRGLGIEENACFQPFFGLFEFVCLQVAKSDFQLARLPVGRIAGLGLFKGPRCVFTPIFP